MKISQNVVIVTSPVKPATKKIDVNLALINKTDNQINNNVNVKRGIFRKMINWNVKNVGNFAYNALIQLSVLDAKQITMLIKVSA